MQTLFFTHSGPELRIDLALKAAFPDYSRSFFIKQIDQGLVQVNKKFIKKNSFLLQDQDVIELTYQENNFELALANSQSLEIVSDEADFFVINKPAGLLTHPATTAKDQASVVSCLLPQMKDIETFVDKARPGIVHRLDRDTSGLLLVAKTENSLAKLANLFATRQIVKKYLVLVKGIPSWEEKVCREPIGRNPIFPTKMQIFGINPKQAETHFKLLKKFNDYSLLEAQIFTGRTHQIRVHLKYLRLPVLGDPVYGSSSELINRQALHAHYLSFSYQEKFFEFQSLLPKDMLVEQSLSTCNIAKSCL